MEVVGGNIMILQLVTRVYKQNGVKPRVTYTIISLLHN